MKVSTANPPFMAELKAGGWRVIVGAFLGSAVGVSSIPFYTLGVFAGPLQAEFGWSRGQIQASVAFSMLGLILAAVPTGYLSDRIGVRKVALAGLICLTAALVALALAGPSLAMWYVLWVLMSVFGSGTTAITWTRGIADWFDRGRGFALGLALMGNGFTAVVAPPLVTGIIAQYGWRAAYLMLAGSVVIVGLVPTYLFFRSRSNTGRRAARELTGMPLGQAVSGYRLWLLAVAFIFLSFGLAGAIPNLVPLMIDRGFSPMMAASFSSLIGISVIIGRAGTGYLLDRFWAPGVGAVMLLLPVAGCLMLASPDAGKFAIGFAVFAIGLTAGMEFDLMGYLCARYFGFRHYGKIFAAPWVGFALGAATGATAFGWVRDEMGSYAPVLFLAATTFLVAGVMLLALGRYPNFAASTPSEPEDAKHFT